MLNKEQAEAIANLTTALRPEWDAPGVMAQLAKVRSGNPFDIALATIRAAANREARTPGVISVTTGEHWREKAAESEAPRPPRPHEACTVCGRHERHCLCERPTKRRDRKPPTDEYRAAREALRVKETE